MRSAGLDIVCGGPLVVPGCAVKKKTLFSGGGPVAGEAADMTSGRRKSREMSAGTASLRLALFLVIRGFADGQPIFCLFCEKMFAFAFPPCYSMAFHRPTI